MVKSNEHNVNCVPDIAKNEISMCVQKMKEQASTMVTSMPVIYKENIKPAFDKGLQIVSTVPSFESVKCSLYDTRKKAQRVKKTVFSNLHDIEVPATYHDILLADYRFDRSVILLFCLEESKQFLDNVKEYFGDGTFKAAPKTFVQLHVIFGDVGSTSKTTNVIPIFYALMTDKKESSYSALFDLIKTVCPQWNPEKFHADFETGVTNALPKIIPTVIVRKCFYHFCKSIWRKSKEIGLKTKTLKRFVGLSTALALLPQDKIRDGWTYIKDSSENIKNTKLDNFFNYMERTWLKSDECIEEWCSSNERHRTNNVCENWNSQINKKINKHVTIAKLLTALKEDSTKNKIKLNSPSNNRRQTEHEKDAILIDTKLQLIYGDITIGHFLEIHR